MNNIIERIKFDDEKNIMIFEGYVDSNIIKKNRKIVFRERNNESLGIIFKQSIEAKCIWEENKFIAMFDLKNLTIKRSNVYLDLYIFDDNFNGFSFVYNELDIKRDLDFGSNINFGVLGVSNTKNLYINIKNKIELKDVIVDLYNEDIKIQFSLIGSESIGNKPKITIKERISRDIFSYYKHMSICVDEIDSRFIVTINKESFKKHFDLYKNSAFDFFLNLSNENDTLIEEAIHINDIKLNIDIDDNYSGIIYKNYKNQLSLLINKCHTNFIVNEYSLSSNGELNIKGLFDNYERCGDKKYRILIEPKMKNSDYIVPYLFASDADIEEKYFNINIDLKEVLNDYDSANNGKLILKLEINDLISKEISKIPILVKQGCSISTDKIKFKSKFELNIVNAEGFFSIDILEDISKVNYNTIKISVLGSCLSRLPFSSNSFFNPNYKKKYQVVSTMFHTSLASLFGKPVENAEDYVNNYLLTRNNKEREYIIKDMKKIFFNELREKKPDFLIIDFYQDAVRDLILFDDGEILSAGINLRNSKLLDIISKKSKIITHNEYDLFMKYWNDALIKFSKEIFKYISPNRVIINSSFCVNEYLDGSKVMKYKTLGGFVKKNNFFFEYMNKAALHKIKGSKCLDLSELGFIADKNHPEGNTPTHYQQEYYKEFLKKLDEIVLTTLLEENKISLN
ncbi:MAG: DUF6270 domain-containing protein [Clostridium sp.]